MKRSTSMSYVDGCVGTWPKEKRLVPKLNKFEVVCCVHVKLTTHFPSLPQLLLSGNLLWDPSGRRPDRAALWSSRPPWHDPLRQQRRSRVQSSLCISRRHQAPPLPHARQCERPGQTHTGRGGGLHLPQALGEEQHILSQEPKQVK